MTKYKEYLRAQGIKLECDFDYLPYKGFESIETRVVDNGVVAIAYSNITAPEYIAFDRCGETSWGHTDDSLSCIERLNYNPAYDAYIEDKCYRLPASDTTTMKDMYINDVKIKTAYKHMCAGLMSDLAFTKLLVKYFQKITAIELIVEE